MRRLLELRRRRVALRRGCYNAAQMSETPPSPESVPPPSAARTGDYITIRRSHLVLMLIPLAGIAGLAAGYLLWGRDEPAATATAAAAPQRYEVSVDDDPALGPADAPVTIVEFSDFNCPYCRRFHTETFPVLMAAYPDQILFVYRDYPITSAESQVAAQAANCAGKQGAYWAYHDVLFTGELGLGAEAYAAYAERLNLDTNALAACIAAGGEQAEVESDARAAAALGVSGTPTFFINGIPLVGAQPLAQFRSVIDAELNP
jgi:protein-disulfide isomerase